MSKQLQFENDIPVTDATRAVDNVSKRDFFLEFFTSSSIFWYHQGDKTTLLPRAFGNPKFADHYSSKKFTEYIELITDVPTDLRDLVLRTIFSSLQYVFSTEQESIFFIPQRTQRIELLKKFYSNNATSIYDDDDMEKIAKMVELWFYTVPNAMMTSGEQIIGKNKAEIWFGIKNQQTYANLILPYLFDASGRQNDRIYSLLELADDTIPPVIKHGPELQLFNSVVLEVEAKIIDLFDDIHQYAPFKKALRVRIFQLWQRFFAPFPGLQDAQYTQRLLKIVSKDNENLAQFAKKAAKTPGSSLRVLTTNFRLGSSGVEEGNPPQNRHRKHEKQSSTESSKSSQASPPMHEEYEWRDPEVLSPTAQIDDELKTERDRLYFAIESEKLIKPYQLANACVIMFGFGVFDGPNNRINICELKVSEENEGGTLTYVNPSSELIDFRTIRSKDHWAILTGKSLWFKKSEMTNQSEYRIVFDYTEDADDPSIVITHSKRNNFEINIRESGNTNDEFSNYMLLYNIWRFIIRLRKPDDIITETSIDHFPAPAFFSKLNNPSAQTLILTKRFYMHTSFIYEKGDIFPLLFAMDIKQ